MSIINLVALVIQREYGVDPLQKGRGSSPARLMLYTLTKQLYNINYITTAKHLGHNYETVKKMMKQQLLTADQLTVLRHIESMLVSVDPHQILNQQIDETRNRLNTLLLLREQLQ